MPKTEFDKPVLNDLNNVMGCGIFTNPFGEVLIIHDTPVQSTIQWVEYDTQMNQFSIIHAQGRIQELGIELDKEMISNLKHGQKITMSYLSNKQIKSSQTVVLVVKDY